jgi:hypothetical protein
LGEFGLFVPMFTRRIWQCCRQRLSLISITSSQNTAKNMTTRQNGAKDRAKFFGAGLARTVLYRSSNSFTVDAMN